MMIHINLLPVRQVKKREVGRQALVVIAGRTVENEPALMSARSCGSLRFNGLRICALARLVRMCRAEIARRQSSSASAK